MKSILYQEFIELKKHCDFWSSKKKTSFGKKVHYTKCYLTMPALSCFLSLKKAPKYRYLHYKKSFLRCYLNDLALCLVPMYIHSHQAIFISLVSFYSFFLFFAFSLIWHYYDLNFVLLLILIIRYLKRSLFSHFFLIRSCKQNREFPL